MKVCTTRLRMGLLMMAGLLLIGTAGERAVAQSKPVGDAAKGQAIFKAQKCTMCHRVGNVGMKMGPELTLVGTRRDRPWLQAYLVNPKANNPKNIMPPVKVKGEELDHLIAYLLSLK